MLLSFGSWLEAVFFLWRGVLDFPDLDLFHTRVGKETVDSICEREKTLSGVAFLLYSCRKLCSSINEEMSSFGFKPSILMPSLFTSLLQLLLFFFFFNINT